MLDSETAVKKKILVVDDEKSMREMLEIFLRKEGYDVETVEDGAKAEEKTRKNHYDLVILDLKMPNMDGMTFLQRLKERDSDTQVIIITAYSSPESAMEAMKMSAYDYIPKPFNFEKFRIAVQNALSKSKRTKTDTKAPTIGESDRFGDIIGKTPQMRKIYDLILRVASTPSNILITGESGTGKELVARSIHQHSQRADKPFVTINCAGIPESLIESELFGHTKGAFTSATTARQGLFKMADGGTVFLDEVGDLSPATQIKLLRVIQEKTFKRLGSAEDIHVDVRIICATNKDLEREVIEGRFREDLYYRLNVINIRIPPLRKRKEDIPLLAKHFMAKYSALMNKDIRQISDYALELLMNYHFPGNVRELENIIERSVALETSSIILPESLTLSSFKMQTHKKVETEDTQTDVSIPPDGIDLQARIDRMERAYLEKALRMTGGYKKRAAELLKMDYRSFRYKLKKYGIK